MPDYINNYLPKLPEPPYVPVTPPVDGPASAAQWDVLLKMVTEIHEAITSIAQAIEPFKDMGPGQIMQTVMSGMMGKGKK